MIWTSLRMLARWEKGKISECAHVPRPQSARIDEEGGRSRDGTRCRLLISIRASDNGKCLLGWSYLHGFRLLSLNTRGEMLVGLQVENRLVEDTLGVGARRQRSMYEGPSEGRFPAQQEATGRKWGKGGGGEGTRKESVWTYLAGVHLELADDLDSDFAIFALGISSSVDVAERTVTHLLDQSPSLETGIAGHLAFALPLFRDDTLQHLRIDVFLRGSLLVATMVLIRLMSRGISGACCLIAIVVGLYRVGDGSLLVMLMCGDIGLAYAVLSPCSMLLLVCMDIGDVGGGLGGGRVVVVPGLFAVANEILEILDRTHDDEMLPGSEETQKKRDSRAGVMYAKWEDDTSRGCVAEVET